MPVIISERKKILFNILPVTIVITLFFLLSLSPCSAGEKIPISTGEWKPYTSAEMEGHGIFSKIVTAAFQEVGMDVTYSFYPWKRCEINVKSGKSFAAIPYAVTDKRKAFANFSDPVSESDTVFFYNVKKHKISIEYERLNELKPYSIVGVLGYFYAETLKKELLDVKYVSNEEKALELIFLKRYDLLPLNSFVGWSLIKKNYPSESHTFSTCKKPLIINTLHLMISKEYPNSKNILDMFNAGLAQIKNKGIYQQIVSEYKPIMSVEKQ